MILSISRRTDVPAFFSEWFFNRVKAGEVYVRNPMSEHQVSRIDISPTVTDCIVFWSKNPRPMLARLDELKGYDYYFQYTMNAYDKDIEANMTPLDERIDTFVRLADRLGRERVIWRYDPILFNSKYTPEYHLDKMSYIAERLKGRTEKCVFSFVDVYASKNMNSLVKAGNRELTDEQLNEFLRSLCDIAAKNDLKLATCAEKIDLESFGIAHNICIDKELVERITGYELVNVKRDGQRDACGCIKCEDIGCYDTCPHGCIYCYANYRPAKVQSKLKLYDPESPILCGSIDHSADKITDRPVRSFKGSKKNGLSDSGEQISWF